MEFQCARPYIPVQLGPTTTLVQTQNARILTDARKTMSLVLESCDTKFSSKGQIASALASLASSTSTS
eukprot:3156715-Amphidinium_carterae.2